MRNTLAPTSRRIYFVKLSRGKNGDESVRCRLSPIPTEITQSASLIFTHSLDVSNPGDSRYENCNYPILGARWLGRRRWDRKMNSLNWPHYFARTPIYDSSKESNENGSQTYWNSLEHWSNAFDFEVFNEIVCGTKRLLRDELAILDRRV